jgi:hypothetical protein
MRRLLVVCSLLLMLASCGQVEEVPTPLPTAVPPAALPSGDPGVWAVGFQHEFPVGIFGQGAHRYSFLIHCPVTQMENDKTDWQYFEVTDEAPLHPQPLYLRLAGLSSQSFAPAYMAYNVVHPEQSLVAELYLVGLSQQVAQLTAANCEVVIFWDNTGRQPLAVGEPFRP